MLIPSLYMLTSSAFWHQINFRKSQKLLKIVNNFEENLHSFQTQFVCHDKFKNPGKPGFYRLSRKCHQSPPPLNLSLSKVTLVKFCLPLSLTKQTQSPPKNSGKCVTSDPKNRDTQKY